MTDQPDTKDIIDQQFLRLATVVARQLTAMQRDPESVLDVHLEERKLRLLINGTTDEWRVSRIASQDLAEEFDMEGAAADIIADWQSVRPRIEQ